MNLKLARGFGSRAAAAGRDGEALWRRVRGSRSRSRRARRSRPPRGCALPIGTSRCCAERKRGGEQRRRRLGAAPIEVRAGSRTATSCVRCAQLWSAADARSPAQFFARDQVYEPAPLHAASLDRTLTTCLLGHAEAKCRARAGSGSELEVDAGEPGRVADGELRRLAEAVDLAGLSSP